MSADSSIPYERPPLSKGFLAGKDPEASIFINTDDFYRKHEIEVQLNCVVDGVDPRPENNSSALWRGNRIRKARRGDRRASEETEHPRGRSRLVFTIYALLKTRNVFVTRLEARSGQSSLEEGSLRWK